MEATICDKCSKKCTPKQTLEVVLADMKITIELHCDLCYGCVQDLLRADGIAIPAYRIQ